MELTSLLRMLLQSRSMQSIFFIALFFNGLSVYAQRAESVSRQVFLQLDDRKQVELMRTNPTIIIVDLITPDWKQKLLEPTGKFFISEKGFETLPLEKKLQVLRNETIYIIVPDTSEVPLMEPVGIDFRNMSESEIQEYKKNKN